MATVGVKVLTLYVPMAFFVYWLGTRQPHRRSGLSTLPSVGAVP